MNDVVTEVQRRQLLTILSHSIGREDEVLARLKDQHGITLTKAELHEHINKLKRVRGE